MTSTSFWVGVRIYFLRKMGDAYKIFTKKYYDLRNVGLDNCSALTDYEFNYANLSWPDGYTQDPRKTTYHTRLGNKRKLIDDYRTG